MNYKENNSVCQLERQRYIDISKQKVENTQNFLEQNHLFNKKTGEIKEINFDFYKKERDTYLYHAFNSIYLQNEMVASGKFAFFLTMTLKGEYHAFKVKDHKKGKGKDLVDLQPNPTYAGHSIHDGYEVLNESFRYLYKNLRDNKTAIKLHYQKVIEPHKNQTPHLHALIYIEPKYIKLLYRHINRMKKKFDLGRIETEKINDTARASAYVMKYIRKTLSGENEELSHYIHGWRTENKIRNYTSSNVLLPRYIYDRLSRNLAIDLQDQSLDGSYRMKEKYIGQNYIELLNNMADITVKTTLEGDLIGSKQFGNDKGKYEVIIEKEKLTREKAKHTERINLIYGDDPTLFEDPIEEVIIDSEIFDETYYKIIDFRIIRKYDKKVIYDKNDYEMVDKQKHFFSQNNNLVIQENSA